jgi:TM2 domain-containing membrane protein YozV
MSQPQYPAQPQPQYAAAPAGALSPKSWLATLLLSIFLGEFGIDRFYLGKVGTGILKLITVGGFGIWWLIDLILVIAGAMKDKQGLPVKYVPGT